MGLISMRASERLEQRNELLEVINQIDADANTTTDLKHFAELISIRRGLAIELQSIGFEAPELVINERELSSEGTASAAGGAADSGGDVRTDSVVAKRRIAPASGT